MRRLVIAILATVVTTCAVLVTCSAVRSRTGQLSKAEADSLFEAAVRIIKKYETMHQPKDWPFVGYGHGIASGTSMDLLKAYWLDMLPTTDNTATPPAK